MTAIEFMSVGDPGNANDEPDSNGLAFGRVDYNYKISKYEITFGQYVEFLNAVAKTDPNGLFNPGMQDDKLLNGIARTGENGDYRYSLLSSASTNKPVSYVNFLDAVRFTNWINNGQGNASTETGAYSITTAELVGARRRNGITTYQAKGRLDLKVGDQVQMSGLTGSGFEARSTIRSVIKRKGYTYIRVENNGRNGKATGTGTMTVIPATHDSGAKYWIPTENEWYKAAYYNPKLNNGKGGYYDWATQSDSTPGNTVGDAPNQANIRTSTRFANSGFLPKPDPLIGPNMLTSVGSFTNSASYYGTFDQDGNVTEWNESIYDFSSAFGDYNGSVNGPRSKRGASFYNPDPGTASRDDGLMPNDAGYAAGFRLASASDLFPANNLSSATTKKPAIHSASSRRKTSSNKKASVDKKKPLVYSGVLSSANELWPTLTPATGNIKLTLNKKHTEATYELNVIGLDFGKWFDGRPRTSDPGDDVAGMHFHHAPFYTVGDVCIGLINPNQENDLRISYNSETTMWTLKGKWTNSDKSVLSLKDSLQYIYAGELYTNIHTERVALGEIRAQFNPTPLSNASGFMAAIAPYANKASTHHKNHHGEMNNHGGDFSSF
jgi:sulfatase modifying factor 1